MGGRTETPFQSFHSPTLERLTFLDMRDQLRITIDPSSISNSNLQPCYSFGVVVKMEKTRC